MVDIFNAGVVKLLPLNNGVPPVAAEYQLIVMVASVLFAVNTSVLPGQIDAAAGVACGAEGVGLTVTFAAVRVVEAQPVAFTASA